jgi:hypothetical protein
MRLSFEEQEENAYSTTVLHLTQPKTAWCAEI